MNESPEQLLGYFQRLAEEQPDVDEWRSGAEAARAWIELIESEEVYPEDFARLLGVVESPPQPPGSGWFDLWIRVRHWGHQRGFSVPDTHPWGVDQSRITCLNASGFEGQISEGKEYRLLDRRDLDGFLRMKNDEGRQRWYPADHFEGPEPAKRTWTRNNGG